jgi:DNA-directed RNA polymerase subunit RPC12/RpoP
VRRTGSGTQIKPRTYTCGHCGKVVGPDRGYPTSSNPGVTIYLCSFCDRPTFFEHNSQVPGVAYGTDVEKLPEA